MMAATINKIHDHAQRVFPNEACGLVISNGGTISVLECENLSHTPNSSFLIDPLLFAQHADNIIAVYHSHPNRSPEPSKADIASAERCNLPFVIVGCPSKEIYTYTPAGTLPAAYEGRPFVYGILDCLSLVADYYRHEFEIAINDGERKCWDWWLNPENANAFVGGFKLRGFVEVETLTPGDVVIMSMQSNVPNHCAVYMGDSVILHHANVGNLSRCEMYGHYWRQRTVCFLRHESRLTA